MKKYKVYLQQYHTLSVEVEIEVNSALSQEELENELAEKCRDWRISRLSEQELMSGAMPGYVEGTYIHTDGDCDPTDDVEVTVEETN